MKPKTLFTAAFMGESNMFEGTVTGRSGENVEVDTAFGRLAVAGTAEPGARVNLCIRPEQVIAAANEPQGHVPLGIMQVAEVSFFGTHHRCVGCHAESNLPLIVRLPQNRAVSVGEKLNLAVKPEDIVMLRQ